LLLGVNGSGKSSVFDVLRKIQDFIIKKVNSDSPDSGKLNLSFGALSDGQKMLIGLYTLLFFSTLQKQGFSLFIDEPDNFVALREIQPWLSRLVDECGDSIEQAVLISHHHR